MYWQSGDAYIIAAMKHSFWWIEPLQLLLGFIVYLHI